MRVNFFRYFLHNAAVELFSIRGQIDTILIFF